MRFANRLLLPALVLFLAACSDDGGTSGPEAGSTPDAEVVGLPDAATDGPGAEVPRPDQRSEDAAALPYALVPPKFVPEKFAIRVTASATIGETGQPFSLDVFTGRGAAEGALTYAWSFDGGEPEAGNPADGPHQVVSFKNAGDYAVSATATDGQGAAATNGVLLRVFEAGAKFTVGDVNGDGQVAQDDVEAAKTHLDGGKLLTLAEFRRAEVDLDRRLRPADLELIQSAVDAGEAAPARLWPAAGSLGAKIRLIHPALLDVTREAEVVFEGAEPLVPVRGLPGYATFVVPPELDQAGTVKLTLKMGQEVAAEFDFEVLPLPAASKEPGARILEALELLEEVLITYPETLDTYFESMKATPKEAAVIQGMMQVARDTFILHRAAFVEVFQSMEPEGRAAFEQIALANGLDEVIAGLKAAKGQLEAPLLPAWAGAHGIDAGTAATLLGILCAAYDIADFSAQVAEINEIAAGYLGWFDWWPLNKVPIVGQVINFLNALSNAISAVTDIVGLVADFLPEIGEMKVEVTASALDVGGSLQASAKIKILLGSKLCSAALDALISSLMDQIKDMLSNRLAASIPLASDAFKQYDYDRDKMDAITGLVFDCIGGIVGAVIDALGIQDALKSLATAICDALGGDPWLPLGPDVLSASCGGMNNGAWTCTEACIGDVAIKGKAAPCGKEREAASGVKCKGCSQENCTGCCDGKVNCLGFGQQSNSKCGTGGAACAPCQSPDECVNGTCTCQSNCNTAGAKQCVGNDVHVCTEVKPGCLRLQFDEACINGATCVGGKCEGGCNASNCAGCCLGNGTCIDPATNDNCGANGSTCGYCLYPDACVGGVCTCQADCANKTCGDDGCGGSCGDCDPGFECTNYQCVCVPDCFLKDCGDDGCDGSCGACLPPEECIDDICNCIPDCFFLECGSDGCGGSCGECVAPETCVGGWCDYGGECQVDADCDDGDPCTNDTCPNGTCANTPATGGYCNDGELCTVWDTCVAGVCKGIEKTCNDSNMCTDDACVAGDCEHIPLDGLPCDDGAPCTKNDKCVNGKCIGEYDDTPPEP
jgi:hypothetical protein